MKWEPAVASASPTAPWWRRMPWLTVAVLGLLVVYNIHWYRSHPQSASGTGPQSALIGQPAPGFSLRTMDSEIVTSLEASTGQVRLIDFWSTGCGPCKRELPSLAVLAHDLGSEPFTLLSVNIDEDMADRGAAIRRALGGAAGAFPILLDDGSASRRYAVYRIPFKVLVDRAGVVRRVYTGGTDPDELRADIQAVLGGKG
jgi:thiol-disulfide isomerase/thioredoxin